MGQVDNSGQEARRGGFWNLTRRLKVIEFGTFAIVLLTFFSDKSPNIDVASTLIEMYYDFYHILSFAGQVHLIVKKTKAIWIGLFICLLSRVLPRP